MFTNVLTPTPTLPGTIHRLQTMLADLQYPDGEIGCRLSSQPQSEVGVRLGELLQGLFELLEPAYEQVTVLQHEPVASLGCRLQQLQGNLERGNKVEQGVQWTQVDVHNMCFGEC